MRDPFPYLRKHYAAAAPLVMSTGKPFPFAALR